MDKTFRIGDLVEGGAPGTEDYDRGRVIDIDGDEVTVAWQSGVRTTQPAADISMQIN